MFHLLACSVVQAPQRTRAAGVVVGTVTDDGPVYGLTDAGLELFPIIQGLGVWGQPWARSNYGPDDLDPGLLLWDVRRFLAPAPFGHRRVVVQLTFPAMPAKRRYYWVVVDEDEVDLCLTDPGFEVDVLLDADLRTLTQVWMGDATFSRGLGRWPNHAEGPARVDTAHPGLVRPTSDPGQRKARVNAGDFSLWSLSTP